MDKMYPTPICAITGRIFNGERLVGYIVTDVNGKIQYLDTAVTWNWAVQNLIQNVKVVSKKDPSKGLTGTNGFELKKVEKIDQSKLADMMNAVTNDNIKANKNDTCAYLVRHSLKKDEQYERIMQYTKESDTIKFLVQSATDELSKCNIQNIGMSSRNIIVQSFVYTNKNKEAAPFATIIGYVVQNVGTEPIVLERMLWSESRQSGKYMTIHPGESEVLNKVELTCLLSRLEYNFRARNIEIKLSLKFLNNIYKLIYNIREQGIVEACKVFFALPTEDYEDYGVTTSYIRDLDISESDLQDYFLSRHEIALTKDPNYKIKLNTQDIQANFMRHTLSFDDKFKQLKRYTNADMDEIVSKMKSMADEELIDKVPLRGCINDLAVTDKVFYDRRALDDAGNLFGGRTEIGYIIENKSDRPIAFKRILLNDTVINSAEVGVIPPHERKALNRIEVALLLSDTRYSFTISNAREILQKYVIRDMIYANYTIELIQALKRSYLEIDDYNSDGVLISTVESKDNIKKYFYDSGKDLTGINKQESNPVGKVNTSVGTVNTTVGNTSTADKKNKSNFGHLMSKYGKR